jgi:hypothetical protein
MGGTKLNLELAPNNRGSWEGCAQALYRNAFWGGDFPEKVCVSSVTFC